MKQLIFRNMQLAVSIGSGFAIYQYFFMTDGAFDCYGSIVVSAFTFVVSSIGTVLKEIIMRKKETA